MSQTDEERAVSYHEEYKRKYILSKDGTDPDRRFYPPTYSDLPLHSWHPYTDIHSERINAHDKHCEKPGGSMEMKAFTDAAWSDVLMEEVGEVSKVRCEFRHERIDFAEMKEQLRAELVQVAAMACAWIDAIDMDYRKS